MDKLLFKLNKELLDLNAMEIDASFSSYLGENITFINEKDDEKSFKVNKEENLIQGRGIKGYFKNYNSEYLMLEPIEEDKFKIHSSNRLEKGWIDKFDIRIENRDKIVQVIEGLNDFRQDDYKWFSIYERSKDFVIKSTANDTLTCIPYLRELELFEYQIKTVKAAINKFKGRVMFCDEVGLGKTVEAGITMMEYITRSLAKKILILVPPSLVEQWSTEMKRKFNLDFIKADDPKFKKMGKKAWGHYDKVISSISTAKREEHRKEIAKINYDLIIVDEAHHLKNKNTVAWKFVNSLNKKYIFLLTATPVQNKLEELYNLITLLKPGQLKTYDYFKKNFIQDKEGLEAKNVDRLRELLAGVMIRNKRSDVDIKFTKRHAETYIIEMSNEEKNLYDDISAFIKDKYIDSGNSALTKFMLTKLQEQMGSSIQSSINILNNYSNSENINLEENIKFKEFRERAEEILSKKNYCNHKVNELINIIKKINDKVLVFTKYKDTLRFLVDTLRKEGYVVAEFHGELNRKQKEEQVKLFKEKADVFICTEAGGEGRNLQFCNAMVNYDLPWNPMAIEQRIGRIHRVGQERDVFVYNLAAKNTVEHYILELLDKKINMFELVVGEVDMILGDIEEDKKFSEIIMDAWANSENEEKMNEEINKLGEQLLENKRKYSSIKELDDSLFGDSFKSNDI